MLMTVTRRMLMCNVGVRALLVCMLNFFNKTLLDNLSTQIESLWGDFDVENAWT